MSYGDFKAIGVSGRVCRITEGKGREGRGVLSFARLPSTFSRFAGEFSMYYAAREKIEEKRIALARDYLGRGVSLRAR